MRIISILYFFLLVYIIAAILFWARTLNKQNELIVRNEIEALNNKMNSVTHPAEFRDAYNDIKERENSRKRQYLGECAAFLAIILIGAGVVYTSIRSNHRLSQQQSNLCCLLRTSSKAP